MRRLAGFEFPHCGQMSQTKRRRKPRIDYLGGSTRVGSREEQPMEYRPVRIRDVISATNKDYFLPAIQREFVWEPDQIERLFDSILGDYPIGSFLFWKVDEKNKEEWTTFEFIRQFDKEHPNNPEANLKGIARDIYLILDGQQRITSLY